MPEIDLILRQIKLSPRLLFAGIFFFASYSAASVLAEEPVEPFDKRGDAFMSAAIAEPSNLIPFLASDSASAEVSQYIFSGLVRVDGQLGIVGDLAEGWWLFEGGKRIVFRLRRNATWHDGQPVLPEDVVFTWKKITDGTTETPYRAMFDRIETINIIDRTDLEVVYRETFSPAIYSWTMGIIPKHVYESQDLNSSYASDSPIGSGPYKLLRWNHGESLELKANKEFYFGEPYLQRVFIRILPDKQTEFLELKNENLDMMNLTPLQFSKQIDTDFFKEKYHTYRWTSLEYTFLAFNLTHTYFSDIRVRKAIAHAIDCDELIKGALLGYGRRITGPFMPESWGHNPDVQPVAFDVEAAKKLLKEAGYEDKNGDGILENPEGEPFKIVLLTNSDNEQRKIASELIQQALKKVGIQVMIESLEWSGVLQKIHGRDFDVAVMGWNLGLDPDIYDIFHSSRTGFGEFNYVSYQNPEVDRLLEEARAQVHMEKRMEKYHRVHEIIAEDQPYVFLYSAETLAILHNRFQDVSEGRLGIGYDFRHWYVFPADRKYGPYTENA